MDGNINKAFTRIQKHPQLYQNLVNSIDPNIEQLYELNKVNQESSIAKMDQAYQNFKKVIENSQDICQNGIIGDTALVRIEDLNGVLGLEAGDKRILKVAMATNE